MWKNRIKVLLLAVLLIAAICGCSRADKLALKELKIHKMNDLVDNTTVEFVQTEIKEQTDIKLGTTNKENARAIYLVNDAAFAATMGYSLENMKEGAFVIANIADSIYCFAPTQEGVKRASAYFAKHFVDADGMITLADGEDYISIGEKFKADIYIGDTSIEEYSLVYDSKETFEKCRIVQYYILQTTGDEIEIASKADSKSISLQIDRNLPSDEGCLEITDGNIVITAGSQDALTDELYVFINTYLGWMYAGTGKEKVSYVSSTIRIPDNVIKQEPWIEEREAIVTLWNLNYARGTYLDPAVSTKNNILDFTEEQIYEYVKMLKYCGFTGVQVTEMCSTWAATDGYEAGHETLRMMADAAHSMDMKFTMWVWGSEFADCGWVDDSVEKQLYVDGDFAYKNAEVYKDFDKYYSIYAELADCCDRVIGHYYDPGNLLTAEDIAFYAKVLKDKCLAVNPNIDFGISCWVDVYDKKIFVESLGKDVTLYECGYHSNENEYTPFRTFVRDSGCRLGTWAWNTCEMETDQLAQMNFNLEVIRSVYQTARKYDGIMKPSYWSEMDAYHVLNVFSLYAAGQLLINPDTESEVIFEQISTATVGPEYADAFAEILSIIQDARSGYTFETYTWSNEKYILKSEDYPAEMILARCNAILPVLDEMIEEEIESYSLPLPISLNDVLRLVRPHLIQIRDYAQFRIGLQELEEEFAAGTEPKEFEQRLYEISMPIKNYNCVIGAWGQIEARAQYEMVMAFCEKTGLDVPMHAAFQNERKQRILAQLVTYQMELDEPYMTGDTFYQWGLAYGAEETARLVQELVDEGLLIRAEDGRVYLTDWENYIYHFD